MSAEFSRPSSRPAEASITQDRLTLDDNSPSSLKSAFSPSQSEGPVEGRLILALVPLLSPLLGLLPSPTLHERLEAITQQPATQDARGTQSGRREGARAG